MLVSPRFSPIVGGGENQARLLAEELLRRGHAVFVVASRFRGFARREMLGSLAVIRLPSFHFRKEQGIRGALENLLFVCVLLWYALWHAGRFDVAFFFWGLDYFAIPAFFFRVLGKKSIIRTASVFSSEIGNLRGSRLHGLRLRGYKAFDRFAAITDEIARRFVDEGVPAERIRRMKNGVDTARFFPLPDDRRDRQRAALRLSPSTTYLLYCGHLNAIKGIDYLLRALSTVGNLERETELLVLGAGKHALGSLENTLPEMVRNVDPQITVRLLGLVEERELYFQVADILVLPSKTEGLPNVLLEAMACGVPCIATKVGGSIDLLHDGEGGLLIDYGDEDQLRKAIRHLVNSPEERMRMGAAGRAKVLRGYALPSVAQEYERLFMELVQ